MQNLSALAAQIIDGSIQYFDLTAPLQLRNLDRLPTTGTVAIVAPLPIVNGSGSPCRALALDSPPAGGDALTMKFDTD